LKQNYDASSFIAGASANVDPLFSLDAGPSSVPQIDPTNAFPAVPANGFYPLTAQLSGTHIRPTKQVLPTVDAWNATLQRQVTNTITAEVAYVGSKGTHGFAGDGPNYDVNPARVGPGNDVTQAFLVASPTTPCPAGSTPNTGGCGAAKYAGFSAFTPQNNRRPLFPRIPFDLGNYYGNDAASTYNAFEVKLEKRFAQGLQFLTHYTYSHAYNYTDSYYAGSHSVAWGPVDFNRNHVWVFNTVYELPFGKGKQFLGDSSKAMNYAVGGWQISNTTNWSSGLPWTPSFGECGNEQDIGQCRPDKGGSGSFSPSLGTFDKTTHTLTYYTPVAAMALPDPNSLPVGTDACSLARPASGPFVTPACGTIGNFGRNVFHGPKGFYSDLSLSKRFLITERFSAQFRMDAFNVFNHPVYAFSANNGAQTCIDCQGGNNGKITSLEGGSTMRQLQFALRFDF
jgi:hypothetical protein